MMLPFFLYDVAWIGKQTLLQFCRLFGGLSESQYTNEDNNSRLMQARISLLWIIAPYIILHSISEHKEFRFLLPILPLICILTADVIVQLVIYFEGHSNKWEGNKNIKTEAFLASSQRSKPLACSNVLIVALILLNYPHLIYLGTVHQRGPIAVNEYLTTAMAKETRDKSQNGNNIQNGGRRNLEQYSVHYLMGCHSAPLYSHLHVPHVQTSAWHLDCSPDCRSRPEAVCESDLFSMDPVGFVTSTYSVSGGGTKGDVCMEKEDNDCPLSSESAKARQIPNFMIMMQNDAVEIDDELTGSLGMHHVASIRHSIKSLSLHLRKDRSASHNPYYSHCLSQGIQERRCHAPATLFSFIDVHFEHMEIYR